MPQRPKVLLLIPHLGGGGAERVTLLLARGLSNCKYDVHLGLVARSTYPSSFLPPSVTVHVIGRRRVRSAALPLLRLVHRLKPEVILSGMAHLNFLVLLLRPLFPRRTSILVRQNSTVSASLHSGKLPSYTALLYRRLYPAADRIICQSDAMAVDLIRQSGIAQSRIRVLPNPIDIDAIRSLCPGGPLQWPGPGPHLLAIGRLSTEKGFDLLLEAFSSLRLKFPAADLTIIGEGAQEAGLQTIRRTNRLETSVHFTGYISHPESYFPGATLFVLSSRQEGLPNALLEAAAGGLPIVAVPSSDGVSHLLAGKPGVWLAPEVSSRALLHALSLALLSLQPGQRFAHSWIAPFRMDRALQSYERLIDETLGDKAR